MSSLTILITCSAQIISGGLNNLRECKTKIIAGARDLISVRQEVHGLKVYTQRERSCTWRSRMELLAADRHAWTRYFHQRFANVRKLIREAFTSLPFLRFYKKNAFVQLYL